MLPCDLTYLFVFQSPYNLVQYSLAGNTRALEYFQVAPTTGVVSLIKPVYADADSTNYEVSLTFLKSGTNYMQQRIFLNSVLSLRKHVSLVFCE